VASEQAALNQQQQAYDAQLRAQQNEFERQQQVQQIEHDQFLSTMQRGTDLSLKESAELANREHTIISDWVDGILGQQTVRDPASGDTMKVPSGWHNSATNQSFLSPDPNANPNGVLDGTWPVRSGSTGTAASDGGSGCPTADAS